MPKPPPFIQCRCSSQRDPVCAPFADGMAVDDGHFMLLLFQLRDVHQRLQLQHDTRVAELEADVSRLSHQGAAKKESGDGDANEEERECISALPLALDEGMLPEHPSDIVEALKESGEQNSSDRVESAGSQDQAVTGTGSTKVGGRKIASQTGTKLNLASEEENPESTFEWWCKLLDAIVGVCILLSISTMFLQLHLESLTNGAVLMNEPLPDTETWLSVVVITEHAFNMVFLIELFTRVYFFRLRFVYQKQIQWFNIIDASLVGLSVLEAYVLAGMSMNVSFMRVVRIIRLFKTLQVVRTFRFFANLRVLVGAVAASFLALFWSMVLLTVVMLIAALSLSQLLGPSIRDEHKLTLPVREWVYRYYGTPARALYTVFEMTFSGCWPNYARVLVEDVSSLYVIFFAIYIAGVVFALTRIITAIFLKDTMAIANNDADMQIQMKIKEKRTYATKLQQFFEEIDTSGDGYVNETEFETMLKHPRASAYLACLEIDASESRHLFHILDGGKGIVSSDDFVRGSLRLKGYARAQDQVMLMQELHHVLKAVELIQTATSGMHADLRMLNGSKKDSAPAVRSGAIEA